MIAITQKAEFDSLIKQNTLVVVDIHAVAWCGPCKTFAPIFIEASQNAEYSTIKFAEIDVDYAEESITEAYKVTVIPTVILFKEGVEVGRFTGGDNRNKLQGMLQAALVI
jgi:thioredoxin